MDLIKKKVKYTKMNELQTELQITQAHLTKMREFISQNVVGKQGIGEGKKVRPAFSAHPGSKQQIEMGVGAFDNVIVKQ